MSTKEDMASMHSTQARRIAVLTSGGDAPGMNALVRAVVRSAIFSGCEAYVVHEGYEGLVRGSDFIERMHWEDVRGWLSRGGTLIGSARSASFQTREGRRTSAKHLVERGISGLVVCGGDGSLTGANTFRDEWPGLIQELVDLGEVNEVEVAPFRHLSIVGTVGSIDNDLAGTDTTIGCYSSLHRICEAVDTVFDTASSHQRGFVIEVMGRSCGWLALMAAISTGADWLLVPENPPRDNWEDHMCEVISRNRKKGKRRTIVIVAEGARDADLNKITSNDVNELLATRLNLHTRVTILGHIQRGGLACVYDRWLATMQGVEAVNTLLSTTAESPSSIITIQENKIERTSLMEAIELTRSVKEAIEERNFDKVMGMRDPEFKEYHEAYINSNSPRGHKTLLPEDKRMRIAIIHVGAPAGGMNPATRAIVRYCYARGHTPIAIHNGFPGLCRHHNDTPSSVRVISWLEAETWVNMGGSEIGTNRSLPSDDLDTTAHCFEKYEFDALFIIGGFEAFASLSQLRTARTRFPSFRIPMILLPATVSNNVPGTEHSLGSDTCLNALVYFCDVIRQSASASRNRVFVIETQGGSSGYVATVAGLAVGAYAVYIPEEGIKLDMIARDVRGLRRTFDTVHGESRAGKLLLRNERASTTYSTEAMGAIIRDEAAGRFETRTANPGHFQQGDKPSPLDRVRAMRLATKCMQELEELHSLSGEDIMNDERASSVIGIRGRDVIINPMGGSTGLEASDTDWNARRPEKDFWRGMRAVSDMLSGRFLAEREEEKMQKHA